MLCTWVICAKGEGVGMCVRRLCAPCAWWVCQSAVCVCSRGLAMGGCAVLQRGLLDGCPQGQQQGGVDWDCPVWGDPW